MPSVVPVALGEGYTPAPVPNPDMDEPTSPENRTPHITPTMFPLTNEHRGDGYVYGSSPQGMDDTRALTIPGVALSVPIR